MEVVRDELELIQFLHIHRILVLGVREDFPPVPPQIYQII
jgi:hypothetical protein